MILVRDVLLPFGCKKTESSQRDDVDSGHHYHAVIYFVRDKSVNSCANKRQSDESGENHEEFAHGVPSRGKGWLKD